jgi:predicted lactoylglutathione lyase
MSTKIFVNLPVADLTAAMAFYGRLGFANNPQFTNDKAACMVISEHNYIMLLTHEFFKSFLTKPMADAHKTTQTLLAISRESRADVDSMVEAAKAQGGREPRPPQEMGFMYSRAFEDLDGHIWEPVWMDPAALQQD